jgi:mannitol/fructose-specific phosphotransferase system IIA component (Ntr-type)
VTLSSLLSEERIQLDFRSKDKWEALRRMVDGLTPLPEPVRRAAHEALVARERVSSTGLERGVAIPHATVDGLDRMQCALAISPEGVPFDSADGRPANLVALLLIPRSESRRYTPILARIAQFLTREKARESILAARGSREVLEAIREGERTETGAP